MSVLEQNPMPTLALNDVLEYLLKEHDEQSCMWRDNYDLPSDEDKYIALNDKIYKVIRLIMFVHHMLMSGNEEPHLDMTALRTAIFHLKRFTPVSTDEYVCIKEKQRLDKALEEIMDLIIATSERYYSNWRYD